MRSLSALYRHLRAAGVSNSIRQLQTKGEQRSRKQEAGWAPFALKCVSFAQGTGIKEKLHDFIMATKTSLETKSHVTIRSQQRQNNISFILPHLRGINVKDRCHWKN